MKSSSPFRRPENTPEAFFFLPASYDPASRQAHFHFAAGPAAAATALRDGGEPRQPPLSHRFTERLIFEGAPAAPDPQQLQALQYCLDRLRLLIGISYYKALLPSEIIVLPEPPQPHMADFLEHFYRFGLGEFAWRNHLDLADHCRFPRAETAAATATMPPRLQLRRREAVPFGGGMGSSIVLEALKASGSEPLALSCITGIYSPQGGMPTVHPAVIAGSSAAAVPLLRIGRLLDPQLIRLNQNGAWNGHVPITGIISHIAVTAAMLYDFDTVVMANEHSADAGNGVQLPGVGEVNHQWSKSRQFEQLFREFLARELPAGPNYFSLLRPWCELQLAEYFAGIRFSDRRQIFLSCNRPFIPSGPATRAWCGSCAKCCFMFLILAPFLPRAELAAIFGRELLGDPSLDRQYRDLLGMGEHKPFDCVGSVTECRAALFHLSSHPDWSSNRYVIALLAAATASSPDPGHCARELLHKPATDELPPHYRHALDALRQPA